MIWGLVSLLVVILILPITFKIVENNLELFLFIVGILSTIISGEYSTQFMIDIIQIRSIYIITGAVLIGGFLFKLLRRKMIIVIEDILSHYPLRLFVFLLIILLGFISSLITAIIASLILVEIVNLLPLNRTNKVNIIIIACFSISLGSVFTPIGGLISTIVASKLNADFNYLLQLIGYLAISGILSLGLLGTYYSTKEKKVNMEGSQLLMAEENIYILIRALKVFIFIIALELFSKGFQPIIELYILKLDSPFLYWVNTLSAVLDNATLAAAEISPKLPQEKIRAILIGLLISGGMMIPGNISNIICASKMKISSNEWNERGIPLGMSLLIVYFIVLFFF